LREMKITVGVDDVAIMKIVNDWVGVSHVSHCR